MSTDSQPPPRPRKHRQSKACARCRRRKIRCDFQYPTCGACATARVACLGFDYVHGVDTPRSTISHLEQEVARLETELQQISARTTTELDVASAAAERLSSSLAATILAQPRKSRNHDNFLAITSPFFLFGSPEPYLGTPVPRRDAQKPFEGNLSSTNKLSSIPRHAVDIMMKNYCEIYRPLYPAIEEAELFEACERVYSNTNPSVLDIFCVYITLAISMQTLMYRDERRATAASYGFWATAVDVLGQAGPIDSWGRLQALQLLSHYAFMNPKHVDCSKCAAAATRLCSQLGLEHDVPSAHGELDSRTLSTRRRLFWNSYNIDCAVNTVRCWPFLWSRSPSTAEFSETDPWSVASRQICLLRELEAEITMAMYYPTLPSGDMSRNVPFSQWFSRIHERMSEWYQTTRQNVNLSEKLEFHELLYQCQILRLNRATPRFPSPTKEMRKKTLQASIAVLKELSTIQRAGKLFNIWHASYFALEAAVCILAIVLTAFHSQCSDHTSLEGVDIITLCRYIQNVPSLLRKISRRWPNVARHASTLDALSHTVMEKMQQWLNGEETEKQDLCTLEAQLNHLSLFPPLPPKGEDSAIRDEPTLVPEPFQAMAQPPLADELHLSLGSVELQLPELGPAPSSNWADPQTILEWSPSIAQDPYAFDGGSGLVWDFEEDILSAFDFTSQQVPGYGELSVPSED